ncbi:hypothetical protein KM043_009978 [Ampulex compressa]|nr:hypothetical protein KM043_009978 [Ampulex compressa]
MGRDSSDAPRWKKSSRNVPPGAGSLRKIGESDSPGVPLGPRIARSAREESSRGALEREPSKVKNNPCNV